MPPCFRRHLPHHPSRDATYFITVRLVGSLPAQVMARLEEEYEAERRRLAERFRGRSLREAWYQARKRHFARVDGMLDRAGQWPRWLARRGWAEIDMQKIHELRPQQGYQRYAFCLMSNHAHLLTDQQSYQSRRRAGPGSTTRPGGGPCLC